MPRVAKLFSLPEFKLRKSANERLEFIRTLCRQWRTIWRINFRINQWWQKPNKQIQYVYSKPIGNDVKPLNITNSQAVDSHCNKSANPPVDRMRCTLIKIILINPPNIMSPLCNRRCNRGTLSPNSLHPI